ncbi:GNAT family N-acetyltransferase [Cellulomonas sp. ATA003]|uniref:GNAT family N-acetyltransferase n=1 Tax=Cellulomonas sp. ATA003 TaxID=3073064 RepID=UPI0037BFDAC7
MLDAPWPDVPRGAFVIDLFVAGPHRRRGTGAALMRAAMAAAPGDRIGLRVEDDAVAARALYARLGFVEPPGLLASWPPGLRAEPVRGRHRRRGRQRRDRPARPDRRTDARRVRGLPVGCRAHRSGGRDRDRRAPAGSPARRLACGCRGARRRRQLTAPRSHAVRPRYFWVVL